MPRAIRRHLSFETGHLAPPPLFSATVHGEHACRGCGRHHCPTHETGACQLSVPGACPACGQPADDGLECIVLVRVSEPTAEAVA